MWSAKALGLIMAASVGLALLFGGYQDPKALYYPALALLCFGLFTVPRIHPYTLVLLALLATLISGALYAILGISLAALVYSAFLLFVFVAAIAIPLGVTAVSTYIRRLRDGRQ